MNWLVIARRDFRDARRSRILALVVGLFVAFVALTAATTSNSPEGLSEAEGPLWNVHGIAIFMMPIVMLVVGYLSIAGERETGRIKYLLGLPNRRWEVVVGKFLSRSLVAWLAIVLSMLVGVAIMFVRYDSVPLGTAAALTVFMLFFAAVYVGIAVGVSALTASRARAMAGVIGVYVLFTVAWIAPFVTPGDSVAYVVENLLGLSPMEDLYEFVFHLSPSFAYSRLANEQVFGGVAANDAETLEASDPFFLQDTFMPVILIGWIVVALGVGYLRFRNAELG
jgi:ABC-2 type transport system permease protein